MKNWTRAKASLFQLHLLRAPSPGARQATPISFSWRGSICTLQQVTCEGGNWSDRPWTSLKQSWESEFDIKWLNSASSRLSIQQQFNQSHSALARGPCLQGGTRSQCREMGRLIWGQQNHTITTCLQAARGVKHTPAPPFPCQNCPPCALSQPSLSRSGPELPAATLHPPVGVKILRPRPAHPSHPPRACHTAVSMTAQRQRDSRVEVPSEMRQTAFRGE